MTTRADRKAEYEAYRKAAQLASETGSVFGPIASDSESAASVHVDSHAGVSLCEDGAYVDAVIWVPRRVMEEGKQ